MQPVSIVNATDKTETAGLPYELGLKRLNDVLALINVDNETSFNYDKSSHCLH